MLDGAAHGACTGRPRFIDGQDDEAIAGVTKRTPVESLVAAKEGGPADGKKEGDDILITQAFALNVEPDLSL